MYRFSLRQILAEGVDGPSGPATSGLVSISAEDIILTSEIPSAVTTCSETRDPCPSADVRPLSKHLNLNARTVEYKIVSESCKLTPDRVRFTPGGRFYTMNCLTESLAESHQNSPAVVRVVATGFFGEHCLSFCTYHHLCVSVRKKRVLGNFWC
uniref:Uncharacterized protein n=1 Tax=Mus spicilegus TaxID=10103 RepID=A0A8C6GPK7_MUSSI